jgi:hypothetical protein
VVEANDGLCYLFVVAVVVLFVIITATRQDVESVGFILGRSFLFGFSSLYSHGPFRPSFAADVEVLNRFEVPTRHWVRPVSSWLTGSRLELLTHQINFAGSGIFMTISVLLVATPFLATSSSAMR